MKQNNNVITCCPNCIDLSPLITEHNKIYCIICKTEFKVKKGKLVEVKANERK